MAAAGPGNNQGADAGAPWAGKVGGINFNLIPLEESGWCPREGLKVGVWRKTVGSAVG